jgi:hypothetical protein
MNRPRRSQPSPAETMDFAAIIDDRQLLLDAALLAQRELRAFYADDSDSEALRTLADAIATAKRTTP